MSPDEKEKVRALVRNLADAVSQADSEGVEDLLDDARMDIQDSDLSEIRKDFKGITWINID